MIPKIIHQVFGLFGDELQDHPMFIECSAINELYCSENKFSYLRWDKDKCETLIQNCFPQYKQLWNDFIYPVQRADFIRYCILQKFGGIYVDMDVKIIKDLEPLLEQDHFFCCWDDDTRQLPYNAIMGASANLDIFNDIIKHTHDSHYAKMKVEIYKQWKGRFIFQTCGHYMLQRVLKKHNIKTQSLLKINKKDKSIVSGETPYFEDYNLSTWFNN